MDIKTAVAAATSVLLSQASFAQSDRSQNFERPSLLAEGVKVAPKVDPNVKFLSDNSIVNGTTIDQRLSDYVLGLGQLLTGYDDKKANSNLLNHVALTFNDNNQVIGRKNAHVARAVFDEGRSLQEAQAQYGNYGYFQMNQVDVNNAIKRGVPEEVAAAMNNGAGKGNFSIQEQATAVAMYIQKIRPEAALAISNPEIKPDIAARFADNILKALWPTISEQRADLRN